MQSEYHYLQLARFDDLIDEGIAHIVGQSLLPQQRKLWALPIGKGGMRYPRAVDNADFAFIASVNGTLPLQNQLGNTMTRDQSCALRTVIKELNSKEVQQPQEWLKS